jgi:hypothetical protein
MAPRQRANRRSKSGSFTPPDQGLLWAWHIVDTHLGRMRLQWQPRTEIWQGEQPDARWTAETAYKRRWVYVAPAPPDQLRRTDPGNDPPDTADVTADGDRRDQPPYRKMRRANATKRDRLI